MSTRKHLLESKNFVSGGNVQVSLRDLPPGYRIRHIELRLEAVFSTGAAQALIAGNELFRIFQNVEIGKYLKVSGMYAHLMGWALRGGEEYLPASIPATNSQTFRRTIQVIIPFRDGDAWAPGDTTPNAEFYRDMAISVDFANATALSGWTTLSGVTGTLRAYAYLDESSGQVSSLVRHGYVDWNGQSIILEPGLYSHIFLFNEDGTVITSAEVATAALAADGKKISDPLTAYEYASLFNYTKAKGGSFRANSATAPVAGEQLTTDPGVGAAAAATVSMEWVPLVFQPSGYKLTQLVEAQDNVRIDTSGSKTSFRVGYRRIEGRSIDAAVGAFQKAGVPVADPSAITAKTESKAPLSAARNRLTRFFPLRRG